MKKLLAALLLLGSLGSAHAQPYSKAQIITDIGVNWPNNTTGAITPALLRSTVTELVQSYVDWLVCTAQGGIVYWDATATPACLAAATAGRVLSTQGTAANPTWLSQTGFLDYITPTRGSMIYRGATAWDPLAPSTSGYLLKTNGTGADPAWSANTPSIITISTSFRFVGNNAIGGNAAQELTANTLLDWIGSTRGSVFYRGAAAWAILTPGAAGTVLQSAGAGADPTWAAVAGTGTVTTITCSTGFSCSSNPIVASATISVDIATPAQVWSGTSGKMIDAARLREAGSIVTLTYATPTVAVDFSVGVNYSLALTGNTQLGNPSAMTPGLTGCIFVTKDITGRTLSYNSNWKFASGAAPALSTTTTTVPDVLCYLVFNSTFVWGTMTRAIN